MTQFRTAFHKVYNSELSQFKTDCTADEDPYRSLDCLRVLSATLDSGIKGTRRAIKLGNGSQFVSFAGETQIPMQTLTTDAAGKPVIGSTNASCAGFDDCINYLDRSRSDHEGAASKGEDDRLQFVNTHNSAVRAGFTQMSSSFGQMSQLILAGVKGINDDLAKIGIKATIKTKDVEGEQLVENEKTGMIDMPKSMKAAMAGQNAYTEIDDTKDYTSAYNALIEQLNKKAVEAAKMKNKCKIVKGDYNAMASLMPKDCSDTRLICGGSKISQAGFGLEELFKKGQDTIDDNDRNSANRAYQQCKRDAMSDARTVTSAEIRRAAKESGLSLKRKTPIKGSSDPDAYIEESDSDARDEARDDAIAAKAEQARDRANQECNSLVFTQLDSLAKKARTGELKGHNDKFVKSLRDMADACSLVPIPKKPKPTKDKDGNDVEPEDPPGRYDEEAEDVTAACEEFKKAAASGDGPKGEEETKADSAGKSEPATNPIVFPGAGTTAPAK